ncbi:hypothetical protein KI387_030685 [Taxus chinensis]|uniref:Remorin C-terminal domain-containing protein n=1 Tax=Taxus chinensis TaxID=29808 RepID=A0AA38FDX6_TAXCH|nr:hypothetical protein KI387_030685 [Taxus chinensis]
MEKFSPDLKCFNLRTWDLFVVQCYMSREISKRLQFSKSRNLGRSSKVQEFTWALQTGFNTNLRYHKALANIVAWEATKKSSSETKLRKAEEKLEKQKAALVERMKNEIATIHKKAEEKKAMVEARRGEEILKVEESGAKYHAAGQVPKKFLFCFSA